MITAIASIVASLAGVVVAYLQHENLKAATQSVKAGATKVAAVVRRSMKPPPRPPPPGSAGPLNRDEF